MYSLDALIQDISQKRGKVTKDGDVPIDYEEVWNCFARYLKSCMEQRRGLQISSFAKIGWQAEKKRVGTPTYKPFFQLTESFCRACHMGAEATRLASAPPKTGGDPCPLEDFNYSKAAIKFSNNLTKDQVFSGLRSLVQCIGEAIASGKELDIALGDCGRLICRGGEPRFAFAQDLLSGEDVQAPAAPDEGAVRTSAAAFRRDAPEEAMGLGVRGRTVADEPPAMAEPAYQYTAPPPVDDGFFDQVAPGPSGSPDFGDDETPNLTNLQYKREVAYKEAMDRHISSMEARASEAMNEREAWNSHVTECLTQEREEIEQKKTRAALNLHFLQQQMEMGEEKRKEQRKEDIVSASAHDFPKFTEPVAEEMDEFVKGQQARMRADLDEQVRTNSTLRNLAKQRERALEVNQLEANRKEMAMLRNAERAKKAYDREALATAWNSEIRMKNIWKAIESHNKVGSSTPSHAPQVMLTDSLPPSRGGSAISAGRMMTGSSRRVPHMGASASMGNLEAKY